RAGRRAQSDGEGAQERRDQGDHARLPPPRDLPPRAPGLIGLASPDRHPTGAKEIRLTDLDGTAELAIPGRRRPSRPDGAWWPSLPEDTRRRGPPELNTVDVGVLEARRAAAVQRVREPEREHGTA